MHPEDLVAVGSLFGRVPLSARDWSPELLAPYSEMDAQWDSIRAAAEDDRVTGTSTSLPLDRYAGSYHDPLYGTLVITRSGDGLRLRRGRLEGPLEHWHYDTFRVRWTTEWRGSGLATFRLGPRGDVESVVMSGMEFRRQD